MSDSDKQALLIKASWLVGKTLSQVQAKIVQDDATSRVITKSAVGYVIEHYFDIDRNSSKYPDIVALGVEIKTSPLKNNALRTKLSSKEPLSLNIINYVEEADNIHITQSSLYKKNKKILFVFYIHDQQKNRSDYVIQYVFIWEMNDQVLAELNPDYMKIVKKIRKGEAHKIHQPEHTYLTICPKHGGKFKDPKCMKSKVKQPYSNAPAEIRAFRFKTKYMNIILSRYLAHQC